MKYIVDRFEGEYVVCEDSNKNMVDFKLKVFPKEVKVGDVVELVDEKFVIHQQETKERKEKISALMSLLWEED